ncbi:integrase core domain-containing protein [Candidatus Avelusimicrobium stercoris]|uniref:integrase core domain-containing protein n=1 Tax=Candidatus Avelusimicrobium stercoris TaxID=1947924 RepID=UPI003D0F83ED
MNANRESFYDRNEVKQKLMQYLIWYNTQKPHQGLKWMTPLNYTLTALRLTPQKSNMYRDLTGG